MEILDQKTLKKILNYNPITGIFTWKINNRKARIGNIAGSLDKDGYIILTINSNKYRAHHLVYLYVYGYICKNLDHINRIRHDNSIKNLRKANKTENVRNRKQSKINKSGYKGVSLVNRPNLAKKYKAQITYNKKNICIGYFKTAKDAALEYDKYAIKYFGKFAFLNFNYE
jgi:hypothetical protein